MLKRKIDAGSRANGSTRTTFPAFVLSDFYQTTFHGLVTLLCGTSFADYHRPAGDQGMLRALKQKITVIQCCMPCCRLGPGIV